MRIPCVCGIDSWSEVEFRAHAGCKAKADRQQRAREAFYDAPDNTREGGVDAAIETATRVRIDADLVRAARTGPFVTADETRTIIERAFRAAGFEVEE